MSKIPTEQDYITCFSTEAGRRVLANIMTEGNFFCVVSTPAESAVENFVKVILSKTGLYPSEKGDDQSRINSYVSNLFNNKIEY
jgi:hypothetical protein